MINKYIITLLCSLLLSCSTMPIDTFNKKLATFEIAYGQILQTIGAMMKNGTIAGEQKEKIKDLIRQVSKARDAVYIAKGFNDVALAESNLVKARTAFKLIQEIVTKLNSKTVMIKDNYYAKRTYSAAIT